MHRLPLFFSPRRPRAGRPALALALLPLLASLLLAACSALPVAHSAGPRPTARPTHDYAWFIAQLHAAGATVDERGTLPPSDEFRASGRVLLVNGDALEVREYDGSRTAEADLGRYSVEGKGGAVPLSLPGGEQAQPTIYETDILLVLYRGGRAETARLLTRLLGPPMRVG